jgi:hypothetical protein
MSRNILSMLVEGHQIVDDTMTLSFNILPTYLFNQV